MERRILIIIILILGFVTLQAFTVDVKRPGIPPGNMVLEEETDDSLYFFTGRVLEAGSGIPIAFTHIINTDRNTAVISDTLGYFFIRARLLDTLYFSAIGYASVRMAFTDSIRLMARMPEILLPEVSYTIQGVMINPLGSYETFRHKVANLELPPSEYTINQRVFLDIESGTDTLDMLVQPSISPVTALYNWLSKEGREVRKYKAILEQEKFEREISYKYSPLIVSGITGYSGLELYAFMDFCRFKKKFLEESDRYEIRDAVMEKQELFEAGKIQQNGD